MFILPMRLIRDFAEKQNLTIKTENGRIAMFREGLAPAVPYRARPVFRRLATVFIMDSIKMYAKGWW